MSFRMSQVQLIIKHLVVRAFSACHVICKLIHQKFWSYECFNLTSYDFFCFITSMKMSWDWDSLNFAVFMCHMIISQSDVSQWESFQLIIYEDCTVITSSAEHITVILMYVILIKIVFCRKDVLMILKQAVLKT